MLATGTVLEERYRIDRLLGEGGMGSVYLATHLRLKRQVAVKSLNRLSHDPRTYRDALEQFEVEAQILASLDHPALASVMDFFESGGTHYLVMEFIEGRTLTRVVELAPRPISQRRVLQWAEELLDVLEYLHGSSPPVIVRDLKPDNIMLSTAEGRLKLIDFGIAKLLLPGKQTRAIVKGVGTEEYAPLEQYGQGSTDQRSDLYSLAATLYFVLTGTPPVPAWRRASEKLELVDPSLRNPSVTQPVWLALKRMLSLSRDDRPADAAQARALLLGAAAGTSSPRPTAPVATPSPSGAYHYGSSQLSQRSVAVRPVVRVISRSLTLRVKESVRLQKYHLAVHSVAFSPTHGVLAAGASFVHLWDIGRRRIWQTLWRGAGSYNCSVAFSTDGRFVAAGSHDCSVRVWKVADGTLVRTLALRKRTFFTDKVRSLACAYGLLAAASDLSNVRVWDISTGDEKYEKPWHQTGLLSHFQTKSLSLAFSPQNQLAAGGSDGSLTIYEAISGRQLERFEGHSSPVTALAFSLDGSFMASGSMDGSVVLWNARDWSELHRFPHPGTVHSLCFSHDGRVLATGASDCLVRLFDMAQGRELRRLSEHTGAVYSVAFSPVRSYLASGSNDRTLRLWSLDWR